MEKTQHFKLRLNVSYRYIKEWMLNPTLTLLKRYTGVLGFEKQTRLIY